MSSVRPFSLESQPNKTKAPFVPHRANNTRVLHSEGYLLEHSPSRLDGVTAECEYKWLRTSIHMVKSACQRLNLDHVVSHTASVLLHQFFAIRSMKEPTHRYYITSACVFLAAKMEDITSVTAKAVCAACHTVRCGKGGRVKGEAQLKDQTFLNNEIQCMLKCESVILLVLNFPDSPVHPFGVVVKVLRGLDLSNQTQELKASNPERFTIISMLLNLTLSSINDSRFTSLCLQYSHETLGMATLWLTLKKVATQFPHYSLLPAGIEFHNHYGIELAVLQDVEAQMLAKKADSFTYETQAGFLPVPASPSPAQPSVSPSPVVKHESPADQTPADGPTQTTETQDVKLSVAVEQRHPVAVSQLVAVQQLQYVSVQQPQREVLQPAAAQNPLMSSEQPEASETVSGSSSLDTMMQDTLGGLIAARLAFKSIKPLRYDPSQNGCSQAPTLARRLPGTADASPSPAQASSADVSRSAAVCPSGDSSLGRAASADPTSAVAESSAGRRKHHHKSRKSAPTSVDPLRIIWDCEPRDPPQMENWLVRAHGVRTWQRVKATASRWESMAPTAAMLAAVAAESEAAAALKQAAADFASKSRSPAFKEQSASYRDSPLSPVVPSSEAPSEDELATLACKPFWEFERSPFTRVPHPAPQPMPDQVELRAFLDTIPDERNVRRHFQRENSPVRTITVEIFPKRFAPEKPNLSHLWFPNKKVVPAAIPAAAAPATVAATAMHSAAVADEILVGVPISKPKPIRLHIKPASKPVAVSAPLASLLAQASSLATAPCTSPASGSLPVSNHKRQAGSSGDSQDKAAGASNSTHRHHHKSSSSAGKKSKHQHATVQPDSGDCSSSPEPGSPAHCQLLSPASPQTASNNNGCGSVASGSMGGHAPESLQSNPAQTHAAAVTGKRKRFWGETGVMLPGGEVKRVCNGSSRAESQADEARLMPPPPCKPRQPMTASTKLPPVIQAESSPQKPSVKRSFCSMMDDVMDICIEEGCLNAVRSCARVQVASTSCTAATESFLGCSSEQRQAVALPTSSPLERQRYDDRFGEDEFAPC